MKKTKFLWEFSLVEDNTKLRVDLNGGMNVTINLKHPEAHYNISYKLADIMNYQFDIGNKTEIPPLDTRTLFEAIDIAREYKKEEV